MTDTGIGIAPEHLGAIFQDFVQVDSPIQKRLRGTGLGLSLSKKLAQLLGGDVGVTSDVGVGSTFSVTIPMRFPRRAGQPDRATGREAWSRWPHAARSSSSTTIPRRATRRAASCAPAGFTVVEAASGSEALEFALDRLDLIVLDVNLPDIDGFEVCRLLRADPRDGAHCRSSTCRRPSSTTSDKVQGLEAGADGYLTHPVEPPVLVATVNAFLRARRAEDAMRASEANFKAVFEQRLNGIALLDAALVFLEVNPAVCRMLGREREDIVGRHVAAFIVGRDALS